MSATGRSPVRVASDQYGTPWYTVDRLLDVIELPGGLWLEPGAGAGAIIQAVNARRTDVEWAAYEIDPKYEPALAGLVGVDNVSIENFLTASFDGQPYPPLFETAILNPPYSLAREFVEKCCTLAGITAALLRVNFLASAERAEWLRGWTPDCYILPNRPSFDGKGTDATEYMWAVFDQRRISNRGKIQILAETPLKLRRKSPNDP